MLVEQVSPQGHPVLRQRFTGTDAQCRVGRDLACDIVVDDEHVAPQHALLTLLADGRVHVRDFGTRNGTEVGGKRVPAEGSIITDHGEVIVGRTRLRIRTQHALIAPERGFRRDFVRRYRTLFAIAGVSACIAYAGFLQWLDAPSSLFRSVATATLVVLGLVAAWSGLWSLITKLNHGSWHVRRHVMIGSIGAASCAWIYWAAGPAAFATQSSELIPAIYAVMAGTALVALYLHLREATYYGRRIALAMAGAATLAIGAVASVMAIGVEDGDVSRVDLGPDVQLNAARVVPNRDIADYLTEVDKLQRDAGRERQKSLLNAPLAED
jgi:FHA domain